MAPEEGPGPAADSAGASSPLTCASISSGLRPSRG